MAWDFAWRDFSHRVRALQSLNIVSSYLIQDGDSWNNVASGYDSLKLLTVRQPLDPGNPESTLQNLTLSDTFRSTQRWSPFDWATNWSGSAAAAADVVPHVHPHRIPISGKIRRAR